MGAATALLGREREQAELYDALSLASKGDPQVVVVAGDAGTGKTTLVADLAGRAEELGFTVAVGHCLDIEADISFAPVVEALRSLVAGVEDLESRPFARRMHALLDPETPRVRSSVHLLEDLRLAVLEAAACRTGAARAGGHALGRSARPGTSRRRSRAPHAAGCCWCSPCEPTTSIAGTRPARRSPRSADCPGVDVSTSVRWAGTASPPSWRRSRRAARAGAGPVGAGALRGQPALRRGDRRGRSRDGARASSSDLFLARIEALPDGPRDAGADGVRGRDPGGPRDAGRAGGARPRASWTRSSASCSTRTCCAARGDSLAVPARAAARGGVRRPAPRRAHAAPRRARRHPPGARRRGPRAPPVRC